MLTSGTAFPQHMPNVHSSINTAAAHIWAQELATRRSLKLVEQHTNALSQHSMLAEHTGMMQACVLLTKSLMHHNASGLRHHVISQHGVVT